MSFVLNHLDIWICIIMENMRLWVLSIWLGGFGREIMQDIMVYWVFLVAQIDLVEKVSEPANDQVLECVFFEFDCSEFDSHNELCWFSSLVWNAFFLIILVIFDIYLTDEKWKNSHNSHCTSITTLRTSPGL